MRKFFALLLLLGCMACVKEEQPVMTPEPEVGTGFEIVLSTAAEPADPASKVLIDQDEWNVFWEEGDVVQALIQFPKLDENGKPVYQNNQIVYEPTGKHLEFTKVPGVENTFRTLDFQPEQGKPYRLSVIYAPDADLSGWNCNNLGFPSHDDGKGNLTKCPIQLGQQFEFHPSNGNMHKCLFTQKKAGDTSHLRPAFYANANIRGGNKLNLQLKHMNAILRFEIHNNSSKEMVVNSILFQNPTVFLAGPMQLHIGNNLVNRYPSAKCAKTLILTPEDNILPPRSVGSYYLTIPFCKFNAKTRYHYIVDTSLKTFDVGKYPEDLGLTEFVFKAGHIYTFRIESAADYVPEKLDLPKSFGDAMVLQRDTTVNVWGWDKPGTRVAVKPSWNGQVYEAEAGVDGKWKAQVETPAAGGPYQVEISDPLTKVTLKDVLIGEVWMCSGQSNMAMKMQGNPGQPVNGSAAEIAASGKYADQIRFLNIAQEQMIDPAMDIPGGTWEKPSPETTPLFSAVGWYFAKELTAKLGVPVGLIVNAWGGSKIETWLDDESTLQIAGHVPGKTIYDGMVYPVNDYTKRGVLWYQGESNRENPDLYYRQMPAMVANFRKVHANENLPFYFAQIAPYKYERASDAVVPTFVTKQLQMAHEIHHTGIIGTTDIGEQTCIHPAAKDKTGYRFAHLALKGCYHFYPDAAVQATGPEFVSVEKDPAASQLKIRFNQPLAANTAVTGVEISTVAGTFVPVTKVSVDPANPDLMLVQIDDLAQVKAVQYAYRNFIPSNLMGAQGFPAFPFRTTVE